MAREFDFLINAEVIVDDVSVAERVFVDALGFPEPRPAWSGKEPGYGFTFLFARVHPSLKVSPTRIEAMALAPVDPAVDPRRTLPFLPNIFAAQGNRPWKTHANELSCSDIDAVHARLMQRGCTVYEMPRDSDAVPFARLWLGWSGDDLKTYSSDTDGGLFLEICETNALLTSEQDFRNPAPVPDLAPGAMVRVLRRSWIVPDLRETLSLLDHNLDWQPAAEPALDADRGVLRAVFRFVHPYSAELELVQPVAAGEIRESLDTWGPGSWAIRIGVNDLAAKTDDLRRRGTEFETLGNGAVVRVDTGARGVPGLFEFSTV
ncbi:hypothetical protein [Nocardia macrotermitis]|uniref:VOC domain-containing protein n=1 Tax=Nocardia macrotermitis TaxID=2585198 RepID=A0A7K0DGA4_9NOCA|nr:hypothetical protein [Nocardia macrotermitis]MQY24332.1 hypothetical protein [Nocardia macrotermitis]